MIERRSLLQSLAALLLTPAKLLGDVMSPPSSIDAYVFAPTIVPRLWIKLVLAANSDAFVMMPIMKEFKGARWVCTREPVVVKILGWQVFDSSGRLLAQHLNEGSYCFTMLEGDTFTITLPDQWLSLSD